MRQNSQQERIRQLNAANAAPGRCVLYWMQQAQRTLYNQALEHASTLANERDLPLKVVFALTDRFPEANARHYGFMLEGLRDVALGLAERGIGFELVRGDPGEAVPAAARKAQPALVVTDCGYLRVQRAWRTTVADALDVPLIQVETDVIAPLDAVSLKEEYAARTIRPKILKQLPAFLKPVDAIAVRRPATGLDRQTRFDPQRRLRTLDLDRSVAASDFFRGGEREAERRLFRFVDDKLTAYHEKRSDPSLDYVSHMSPYLHFGQISPLRIALAVSSAPASAATRDAFIEELIVRRELSVQNILHARVPFRKLCANHNIHWPGSAILRRVNWSV